MLNFLVRLSFHGLIFLTVIIGSTFIIYVTDFSNALDTVVSVVLMCGLVLFVAIEFMGKYIVDDMLKRAEND